MGLLAPHVAVTVEEEIPIPNGGCPKGRKRDNKSLQRNGLRPSAELNRYLAASEPEHHLEIAFNSDRVGPPVNADSNDAQPPRLLRPSGIDAVVAELQPILDQVDEVRTHVDELSPPGSDEEERLQPELDAIHIYQSNAIEGNSLTSDETEDVVIRGATIDGKPMKDVLEAKNLQGAIQSVRNLLARDQGLDEQDLLMLHHLVMKGIQDEDAGRFRDRIVKIGGASVEVPEPYLIRDYMDEFWSWLDATRDDLHPVVRACIAHWWLVRIHPFRDGNGRVSRLLFYFLLGRAGYRLSPVIVKAERERYYALLSQADDGDLLPFCEYVATAVLRAAREYERTLTQQKRALASMGGASSGIKAELERQQLHLYEAWKLAMERVQVQFRSAAQDTEASLGAGVAIEIYDFGVLSYDDWKSLVGGGRISERWFFKISFDLPTKRAEYLLWFVNHPKFVREALGISKGIGLCLSRRGPDRWESLMGPGRPHLRHLLCKDGHFYAHTWLEGQDAQQAQPVDEVDLKAVALEVFREILEEELSL